MNQIEKDKLVKGAIREINQIRAKVGLKRVTKIRPWKDVGGWRSHNCPVAQTFKVGTDEVVSVSPTAVRFGNDIHWFVGNGPLNRFVEAYDDGDFPEYGGPS